MIGVKGKEIKGKIIIGVRLTKDGDYLAKVNASGHKWERRFSTMTEGLWWADATAYALRNGALPESFNKYKITDTQ